MSVGSERPAPAAGATPTPAVMLSALSRALPDHAALQQAISDRVVAMPGCRRMEAVASLWRELCPKQ